MWLLHRLQTKLQREPVWLLARNLGISLDLLQPWRSFLEYNRTRFCVRDDLSDPVHSNNGYSEHHCYDSCRPCFPQLQQCVRSENFGSATCGISSPIARDSMISSNPRYTALKHVLTCRLITRMNSRFPLCPLSFSICLQMAPAFRVRTQDSLLQHGAFIIRVMTNALQGVCCRALFNRLTVQSCWPSSLLPSGVRSTGWTLPKTLDHQAPPTLAQCIRAVQLVLTSLAKVFFPDFF